jgi:hypothetical protein
MAGAGAVDVSRYAAMSMVAGEEAELWERAGELGAVVHITGDGRGRFSAMVAGFGHQTIASASDPYRAGLAALDRLRSLVAS